MSSFSEVALDAPVESAAATCHRKVGLQSVAQETSGLIKAARVRPLWWRSGGGVEGARPSGRSAEPVGEGDREEGDGARVCIWRRKTSVCCMLHLLRVHPRSRKLTFLLGDQIDVSSRHVLRTSFLSPPSSGATFSTARHGPPGLFASPCESSNAGSAVYRGESRAPTASRRG